MRNLFGLTFILFSGVLPCFAAGDYNVQWQKGNAFYQQKQYDSAAWYFEQIAALKPRNADVYYNLGNTYYRLNNIPHAVLNFERALKINPEFKNAADNLALTQSRINNHILTVNDIFFIKWWKAITRSDKAGIWSIAALSAFLLILVILILKMFLKAKADFLPVQFTGVLGFVCICFLVLAYYSSKNRMDMNTGVVMQADAPLMNNEWKGKPLTLIPEGTTVKIDNEKGSWLEVTLPDGRTGWVQSNIVEKI
jgi:hypothetical protein